MEGYLFFYLWLPEHLNTVTKLHFTHPAVPKRQFSSPEKQQKIFKNFQEFTTTVFAHENRPYHFKFFKGSLPQILLGPFLKTLVHISTTFLL